MIEYVESERARHRGRKAMSAAVVVVCYLIVFAGLLFTMMGGTG